MRRRWLAVGCVGLANCVGTNPYWDPPLIATDGPSAADEDDADASTTWSTGDSDGVGGDDGVPELADSSTSTTEEDGGDPVCAGAEMLCGGECTNIETDKHACGIDCIDCTQRYGNHARCRDGECEPKEDD